MSDKNEFTQTTLLQASPVNTPVGQSNRNYLSNAATPSPVPSLNPPPHSGGGAGAGAGTGGGAVPAASLADTPKVAGGTAVGGAGGPSAHAKTKILYDKHPDSSRPPTPSIPFWSENPNILLHREYAFEFFPTEDMTYNQKLNAVSRVVIILTLLSFVFTQNFRILFICLITLVAIYFLHRNHVGENDAKWSKSKDREGYQDRAATVLNGFPPDVKHVFAPTTAENPFENVLLPDYDYNPQKKPAPPSFNENIGDEILKQAKQLVLNANPDQPDLADKLFNDLGNQLVFEQSLQPFYSNPATTIPNDQEAFAEFCYGSMISCKEGNLFACARNLPNQALI
jgi:hypothetical protein